MTTQKPLISVATAVYNGGLYLNKAIESILNQSFGDFEFIIVDDGSTDNTQKIIRGFQDGRIVYLRNNENAGIVASLNRALEAAKGTYIARMDADDIALPERLGKQQDYLNSRPDIGLLGCWYEWIDGNDNTLCVVAPPETHDVIIWNLLFNNCIVHSGVMFRRSLLSTAGCYSAEDLHGEDYGLWVRMAAVTGIANVPEVLVKKRMHKTAIGRMFPAEQERIRAAISRRAVSDILGSDAVGEPPYGLYKRFIARRTPAAQEKSAIKRDMIEKSCQAAVDDFRGFPFRAMRMLAGPFVSAPLVTGKTAIRKIIKRECRYEH